MAEVEPITLQVWYEALGLALLYAWTSIGAGYFLAKLIKRPNPKKRRAPKKPDEEETKKDEDEEK